MYRGDEIEMETEACVIGSRRVCNANDAYAVTDSQ